MNHITHCLAIVAIGSMMTALGCDARNDGATRTTTTDTTTNTTSGTNPGVTNDRSPDAPRPADADNTRNNRGDGSNQNVTPLDQSQSSEHIRLTADIRRAVMSDENMSMTAKNCKIITTSDGVVTLRGVVQTAAERSAIEAHAVRIAGTAKVVNELEINND